MLFADDHIEAFSQLYVGKYENLFGDETKDFARAYVFACHPCDDLQTDLEDMGITVKKKFLKKTLDNGVENFTEEEKDVPMVFQITPLKTIVEEILRKRHPANRRRAKEFIELNTGSGMNDITNRQSNAQMSPQEPNVRGRIN